MSAVAFIAVLVAAFVGYQVAGWVGLILGILIALLALGLLAL